ncbi:MAG TPA: TetR family transcriptional regulator [Burkholderiaceae bacterium]|jgi:AcrR family transcriptional regulator|nr:TetR family transcriptional regulator [Burkholderiaceae bacterium]
MPRPSQQIDEKLLASGRALFPANGCAGLSVRAVSEHAGVNPAMFHYHFKTKDNFLRTLLQQMYEDMFSALSQEAKHAGPALRRLEDAIVTMAGFARERRAVIARVWMDAMAGEPVAIDFFRSNAPRHIGLLFALLHEAQGEGALAELPPLQRFVFVMGSVLMPLIFLPAMFEAMGDGLGLGDAFATQVASEAAIRERVRLALRAIAATDSARSLA